LASLALACQRDSFIRKEVTGNTDIKKRLIKTEDMAPGHVASWTGHITAHPGHPAASHQYQSQPHQSHRGPSANQPRDQRFIIARGLPEASSRHGNAAVHRGQHHSKADDKVTASKPQPVRLYDNS